MDTRAIALTRIIKSATDLEGYGVPIKHSRYHTPDLGVIDSLKASIVRYIPDRFRGSILANSYLRSQGKGGNGDLAKVVLSQPGATSSLIRYLQNNPDKIGQMAAKSLEGKWHSPVSTRLAKLLVKTDIGKNIITNNIIQKSLPTINGDSSYAMECLSRGGNV